MIEKHFFTIQKRMKLKRYSSNKKLVTTEKTSFAHWYNQVERPLLTKTYRLVPTNIGNNDYLLAASLDNILDESEYVKNSLTSNWRKFLFSETLGKMFGTI